jgi:putative YphP/YqiW family bacilliredoxin
MYDPRMVQPMRDEVTSLGVQELRTAEEVDAAMAQKKGTTLVFVNSVCGCAAGNARPALRKLMQGTARPDRAVTVFAGQDREATAQARTYFTGQPPSSPCFALLKDGVLVGMLHRHNIEGRTADEVAGDLQGAVVKFREA